MKQLILPFLLLLLISSCVTDGADSRPGSTSVSSVYVEGGLMYPGAVFPPDFRVVAKNKNTGERLEFDFAYMSRDKKFPNGVGYRIPLKPGIWRIWAESREKKVSFFYKDGSVEVKNRSLKEIHLDQMKSGTP